ncbi:MAG: aminoacyl-histidine dipeptidase [Eubacterium sp.]|nr:aminoacyl-histidine dipeptidase [Eubacterium sp.]
MSNPITHPLSELEPHDVFSFFYDMSQIPRPSGKERAISDYLVSFAKEHDLEWHRDAANNVIIIKEASAGREAEEPLILQGHMDMVCEKEISCPKDMDTEGLNLTLDGDWVSAEGTTLGGDDGIAVAISLALLADETLSHPRLEVICTTEEETGMGGAHNLDATPLKGRLLLNIDSETEGILTAGCAGGATLQVHLPVTRCNSDPTSKPLTAVRLSLGGLTGGHSGSYIQYGRANADLLLVRLLREFAASHTLLLCSLAGGTKHNAIPRDAEAVVLTDQPDSLLAKAADMETVLRREYDVTDPDLKLEAVILPADPAVSDTACAVPVSASETATWIALLSALPNGVQRMDQHLDGLVETSLNLGILKAEEGELFAEYLLRSSTASCLQELIDRMSCIASAAGASVNVPDRYPAWQYVPDSAFREKIVRIFREQYGKDPVVETIHAGLECGLLSEKIPGLDAVSIGPDIPDIHTPQEKMSVSSVQRTYAYIRKIVETK